LYGTDGSGAGRGHRHIARLGFRRIHEVRERLVGRVGLHHEHLRLYGDERYRREVLERVVGHALVQRRIHGQVRGLSHAERVTVRRRFGDCVEADVSAAARLVLDDDGPLGGRAHFLGDEARKRIGAATRRERHDEADRPVGPFRLRGCVHGKRGQHGNGSDCQQVSAIHCGSSFDSCRPAHSRVDDRCRPLHNFIVPLTSG
jgi:hypothetical protein